MRLEGRHVAVVEDDPIMGESLIQRLQLEGYDTTWAQSGGEAIDLIGRRRPDIVVCDIRLPDMSGEELFRRLVPSLGASVMLFITAYGDIDQAVRLMRAGAADYLTKPFPLDLFLERIGSLLPTGGGDRPDFAPVLGSAPAMREIEATLRRVLNIDSTLLLTGESGVGKEVAARFVHEHSKRRDRPFMAVNCAAIPGHLLESELFGHERGAFTGATARHEGYAERARDGILLLDEISELPPAMQAKLLRLVQDRSFSRVGGERLLPFSARLLCATNIDLEAAAAQGLFRNDLLFRINVISVRIPPLRDRRDDIVPLTRRFFAEFVASFGSDLRGLRASAEAAVRAYRWPGNVRELRNRVERAVALAQGPWIETADLFPDLAESRVAEEHPRPLDEARRAVERDQIVAALAEHGGRLRKTAEALGISRTTLWEKMRRHGIPPGR
jgi:DNA-binding NtrC family response regulator